MDIAFCNCVSLGLQPSEIENLTWRKYLVLMLGRAEAEANAEPERVLSEAEQASVHMSAMDILMHGPAAPE